MLKALIISLVEINSDDELKGLLWATAYGFFIMSSYYILRAVRDEISSADRGNLQILWTVVFLVMLVAVPLYSWLASKWSRGVFVPLANRFFIACLVAFWLCIVLLPETARPWIDRVFYVWTSVFALFVVTVFWGLLADCFDNAQAKRMFGFIAVGSSIGGMAGSSITAGLAESGAGFLAVADRMCSAGDRFVVRGDAPSAIRYGQHPHSGGVGPGHHRQRLVRDESGVCLSLPDGNRSIYRLDDLRSTMLYFQQANLVAEAFTDRGVRTAFFAKVDLAVSILTIVFQVYLTARIIKWLGVGLTLVLVPVAVAAWFSGAGPVPDTGGAGGRASCVPGRSLWPDQTGARNTLDRARPGSQVQIQAVS